MDTPRVERLYPLDSLSLALSVQVYHTRWTDGAPKGYFAAGDIVICGLYGGEMEKNLSALEGSRNTDGE